jgi:hypothetical protein
MKKIFIISILLFLLIPNGKGQNIKKDTVRPDTIQVEKIKKMPMDTVQHTMPVKKIPPQDGKMSKPESETIFYKE